MRILLAHNRYRQIGGEDTVLLAEEKLLRRNGHTVIKFLADNRDKAGLAWQLHVAWQTVWSESSKEKIAETIKLERPDVVHVHNFFPLLTPSIYEACREARVPVVQTLHNFRIICPGALLARNGKPCEDCVTRSSYHAVRHRCYRNSYLGTLAVSRMVEYHRKRKTWQYMVDRYIALTEFGKAKFVQAGLPAGRIVVKPNFVQDPFAASNKFRSFETTRSALFVGRLSNEKGIHTLLRAWRNVDFPLRIAGSGPLKDAILSSELECIVYMGLISSEKISQEMQTASFLVMPSEWYEGFPMVLVEAMAHGLPVIASRLGSMVELVENGVTGLHFSPGDGADLAAKIQWAIEHPEDMRRMGLNARKVYELRYTPEENYRQLMSIYETAICECQKRA